MLPPYLEMIVFVYRQYYSTIPMEIDRLTKSRDFEGIRKGGQSVLTGYPPLYVCSYDFMRSSR